MRASPLHHTDRCTFGRRLRKSAFPRSYVRIMQPIHIFFTLKSKLFR